MRAVITLLLLLGLTLLSSAADGVPGDLGFDQRIGAPIPADLGFVDDHGSAVRLGDFVGAKPIVLVLAYYTCRNLCGTVLGELAARLDDLDLKAGRDFRVVVASFDPADTVTEAREAKARYGERTQAWHFLTGPAPAIETLARTVGFHYRVDAAAGGFIHPAGVMLVTPEGRISRYVFGLGPDDTALRYGLIEASGNRLGTMTDRLWLLCHAFDPATGKYTSFVTDLSRGVGLASIAAFAGLVGVLVKRRRR